MNNHAVFSFFSGSGFLDLGFENSDFDIAFVNELNPDFMKAYKYSREHLGKEAPRFGYHENSIDDFLAAEEKSLKDRVTTAKTLYQTVGFIGGPPCPDFSVGGKNKGREGENGRLSKSYIDTIINNKPDWFLFENVKGLWRTTKHREFYEQLKHELSSAGYEITDRLVNSLEFGAPQDRQRILMFGVLKTRKLSIQNFNWEQQMKFPGNMALNFQWPSKDCFQGTPTQTDAPEELTINWWFNKNNVETHPNGTDYFTPRAGLAKFEVIEEGDDSKKSYKRLHRNRYSPTAAYGNNEVHLHPWLARRISAAEALAIQSLPKEFVLPPTMTLSAKFKTIGNGVPYLLAVGMAKTIDDFLQGK
ncbi:DNA cytosine methyltransferase [Deefgea salmonis]|uniref:DNA (cytosine-5-)-methyltransferase n=1 Tax=Deefgea salmonis TaxID=2875502 RepID=A0ABS8BNM6_9NEIS|nr:DNA cytosine methyltransferase [Deefgea salmonis]MCB5197212.1 DNA cytosine methyltransferase [Deefgea salmonis]